MFRVPQLKIASPARLSQPPSAPSASSCSPLGVATACSQRNMVGRTTQTNWPGRILRIWSSSGRTPPSRATSQHWTSCSPRTTSASPGPARSTPRPCRKLDRIRNRMVVVQQMNLSDIKIKVVGPVAIVTSYANRCREPATEVKSMATSATPVSTSGYPPEAGRSPTSKPPASPPVGQTTSACTNHELPPTLKSPHRHQLVVLQTQKNPAQSGGFQQQSSFLPEPQEMSGDLCHRQHIVGTHPERAWNIQRQQTPIQRPRNAGHPGIFWFVRVKTCPRNGSWPARAHALPDQRSTWSFLKLRCIKP